MESPLIVHHHAAKPLQIQTVRSLRRHLSIAGMAALAMASIPAPSGKTDKVDSTSCEKSLARRAMRLCCSMGLR